MPERATRPPVAAGRYYPDDAGLLLRQIDACYSHPLGPGAPQTAAMDRRPLGLIVPHGALGHAGPVAAHAFACLERGWRKTGVFPELVVLLGPDHLGRGSSVSATRRDYATPLGSLATDLDSVDRLCASNRGDGALDGLTVAEAGHDTEHSLENVVPFLQHQAARFFGTAADAPPWNPDFPKLLPLTVRAQDFETAERLAAWLDSVLPGEKVLTIATCDLCHCGPLYGNRPVSGETPQAFCCRCIERVAEVLGGFDPGSLVEVHRREAWSLCGVTAMVAVLHWARLRGGSNIGRLCSADSVAVARAWNDHPALPKNGSGALVHPWNLLTEADPNNPVGFGSFLLT